jgi:histidyl-tRNA synthetase
VLLANLLDGLGVAEADRGQAMIIIDKLDKIFAEGVVAELGEKFGTLVAEAAAGWLSTLQGQLDAPAELANIFAAVEARHGKGKLRFDPTLVRGMGYYTGPIFEIEHPGSGSSIGGGGRYDGMVGRWLGQDAPAVGISIGFERAVDLVAEDASADPMALVLVLNSTSADCVGNALRVQAEAIAAGYRVRLEQRPKKLGNLLEVMQQQGFGSWAAVGEEPVKFADLEVKPLG